MLIGITRREAPDHEGWQRRFTADPQRAEEMMELYRQLGFEVRAEPAPLATAECAPCHATMTQWLTIYTRKQALTG